MKVQPAVKAETRKIAIGVCLLTVLMAAVFLILRQFDYTVLLGAILGSAAAIGNFFLMALTVQKVTEEMPALPKEEAAEIGGEEEEEEAVKKEAPLSPEARQAGRKMQASYLLRMLMLLGIAAAGVAIPAFHPWATLIPMPFPRIVIALMSFLGKNQKEAA